MSKTKAEKPNTSSDELTQSVSQYFTTLSTNIQKADFLVKESDLDTLETFVLVLNDVSSQTTSQEKEFMLRVITYTSYFINTASYEWASLRSYFTTERIKKVVTSYIHFIVMYLDDLTKSQNTELIPRKTELLCLNASLQLLTDVDAFCDFTQLSKLASKLNGKVPTLSKECLDTMKSVLLGKKELVVSDINVLDKTALKSLLLEDVTRNENVEENVKLIGRIVIEAQRTFNYDEFGISKYFEFLRVPIRNLKNQFTTHKDTDAASKEVLEIVGNILLFLMNTFQKFEPTCVGRVAQLLVDLTELHDTFSEGKFHNQCEDLVTLIYSTTVIIGDNIGNVTVLTNMQAYCASHLFLTLLPSNFNLKEFMSNLNDTKDVTEMPCLYPMAVALTFSREVFQKIASDKKYVVDESSYRNVSSTELKLKVFDVSFDALALQTNAVLATIILSPNGAFLDTIFALLVLSFLSVGFQETLVSKVSKQSKGRPVRPIREVAEKSNKMMKSMTRLNFSTTKTEEKSPMKSSAFLKSPRTISTLKLNVTGAKSPRKDGLVSPRKDGLLSPRKDGMVSPRKLSSNETIPNKTEEVQMLSSNTTTIKNKGEITTEVDYDITRSLPLYLSIYVFGESNNEELRNYVKKYFNAIHLDVIIFLTSVQSVSAPLIKNTTSPCGPLVKDRETIMNLRSLCSSLVNYNWLSDQLMGYLIRKQAKEYPVVVPVEFLVFLARVWTIRISSRKKDETNKEDDDMQAVNLWESMIKTLEKNMKEKNWNGGENLAHEYVLLMLLIYTSFKEETKQGFIKKMFNLLTNFKDNLNNQTKLIISRVTLMLHFMLTYTLENASELMEEIRRVLMSRKVILEESENLEVPQYFEMNTSMFDDLKRSQRTNIPPYGYAKFYTIMRDETHDRLLNRMRKAISERKANIDGLMKESMYNQGYIQLLDLLKMKNKEDDVFSQILREYLFHNVVSLLSLLPPPKSIYSIFTQSKPFTTFGLNDGLIVMGLWLNIYTYDIVQAPDGISKNAKEIFKDVLSTLNAISEELKTKCEWHAEAAAKIFIDTINCHIWTPEMVAGVVRKMEEANEVEEEVVEDDNLLVRKKVVIKIKEDDKVEDGKDVTQREMLLSELRTVSTIAEYQENPNEKKNVVQSKKVNKMFILDNVPIVPISEYGQACFEMCVKSPSSLFEILAKYIRLFAEELKQKWPDFIYTSGVPKVISALLVNIMYRGISFEVIEDLLIELGGGENSKKATEEFGDRIGFTMKEVVNPIGYLLEGVCYHPITATTRSKISSTQMMIESVLRLAQQVCERDNIVGNYQQNVFMKDLFRLSGSYLGKFVFAETEAVAKRLCGENLAGPMMSQSVMPIIDDFIDGFLINYQKGKKKYHQFVPIVRAFFDVMKDKVDEVMDAKSHGRVGGEMYYYQLNSYHRKPSVMIYLKCAAEVSDKELGDSIMSFVERLCQASPEIKEEISTAIEGGGGDLFAAWAVQKIVGYTDEMNIFRHAETQSTVTFFAFVTKIMKINAVTGNSSASGTINSLTKAFKTVFEKYPAHINRYFRVVSEFALEAGDFSTVVIGLNGWLQGIIESVKSLDHEQVEGISGMLNELQKIVMRVPIPEKKVKSNIDDNAKCTKEFEQSYVQPMYHCYTCEVDCCAVCVRNCHDGHDTVYIGREYFNCPCVCKTEEERKKERKRNKEDVVKDKKQQLILRALNRDSMLPSVLNKLLQIVEKSDDEWKEVKLVGKSKALDALFKKRIMSQYEGIALGFTEKCVGSKEWLKMATSQNTRSIPLIEKGVMKQNLICCDSTYLYHVYQRNEVHKIELKELAEQSERKEEDISLEVPFEIVEVINNPFKDGVIAVSGFRNVEVLLWTQEETKQIDIVMDCIEKDVFIMEIKFIDAKTLAVITPTFVRIFSLDSYYIDRISMIESIAEYRPIVGDILSCVITATTPRKIVMSTSENAILSEDLPTEFSTEKVSKKLDMEYRSGLIEGVYILRYLQRENLLLAINEEFDSWFLLLNSKGEMEKTIATTFEFVPTTFLETTENTLISVSQEMKCVVAHKLFEDGMNYLKLYENKNVGGMCYDASRKIVYVATKDGDLVALSETEELETIEKLKPKNLTSQTFFENYECVPADQCEVQESRSKIIVPSGGVTLYKTHMYVKNKVIRGIRILVGEKSPKQINFAKRSFPIGEGNRWYDIPLSKEEAIDTKPLMFSYCSEPGNETSLQFEAVKVYAERDELFNYEERKEDKFGKMKEDEEKATVNTAEELCKTAVEIIESIFMVTRYSKDRDASKSLIVETLDRLKTKKFKVLEKSCESTKKSLVNDDQSQTLVTEYLKLINENMRKNNTKEEWVKYILYVNDAHVEYQQALMDYNNTNPRFVTNLCGTILSQVELTESLVSCITTTLMRNIDIFQNYKAHYKQHFEVLKTIFSLPMKLAEAGLNAVCCYYQEVEPRLEDTSYIVRIVTQVAKIVSTEKKIEEHGGEVQIEFVSNVRQSLQAIQANSNEEKMHTVTETQEVDFTKVVNERAFVEVDEKMNAILIGLLDCLSLLTDTPQRFEVCAIALYWILFQQNYRISEELALTIVDRLIAVTEESKTETTYICLLLLSHFLGSLDFEYYQQYTRNVLKRTMYDYLGGILPLPSVAQSRSFAGAITQSKQKVKETLFSIFGKEVEKVSEKKCEQFNTEKTSTSRLPFTEDDVVLYEEIDVKMCQVIVDIMYFMFNYNRDMQIENTDKDIWENSVQKLATDPLFKGASYGAKRMLYQFGGGSYAYHVNTDTKVLEEVCPQLVESATQLLREENATNVENYVTNIEKIIGQSLKRPNLFQQFVRNNNDVFLMLIGVAAKSTKSEVKQPTLVLLRCVFLMNVDRSIREKPMEHGVSQLQTILNERQLVCEDIVKNAEKERAFVESLVTDLSTLKSIISSSLSENDETVLKELTRLIEVMVILANDTQRTKIADLLWALTSKIENPPERFVELLGVVSFFKAKTHIKVDKNVEQYLD
ncbi:hypothetical protein EIN_113880 [Entamoeba invadens IP1]|uniref:UBR-type domain-containing protein n=1 Tax=Entamoeba invadens IP1 TaxID=370355 RepID=A0A0A1U3T8_ENTIV|nr:hypothetical protein EIN_113880 [Entamoeba invadens IP1]ELP86264.1 hypothetical protein EIN_113880 [Entamoeba invadens IP1]|eukprot:XP_004185610.1 hypothetical protein EIN_113880 [Entamoeba invadens IP1]